MYGTWDNPLGLACLGKKYLAFPGRSAGHVQLIELETGNISIIPAHSSALRAMALSPDGEVLATASETVSDYRLRDSVLLLSSAQMLIYKGYPYPNILNGELYETSRAPTRRGSCGDIFSLVFAVQ